MSTSLQRRLKRAGRLLPVALLPFAAQAQFNYNPGVATNTLGTYTDLSTTGAALATANTDDANSTAQNIGFTFTYNGTAFTQFVLNTNGFIKLGATAPSAAALFLPEDQNAPQIDPFESTNPADVNILAPFNFDLTAGSAAGGTEYRVATTGTAPNRVCTIQWKNVADKTLVTGQQYASMNFQVRLYETSNTIEFVYDAAVRGTATDALRLAVVGIKGSSIGSGQSIVVTKASVNAWSTASFLDGFYTANAHNFRGSIRPDAGRTYRFPMSMPNDAAVSTVYIQGQLSAASLPQAVQAIVTNQGLQQYAGGTATLTVKRGTATLYTNSKTLPSIAVGLGRLVIFDPYPAAVMNNIGTNTVTVSLSSDDNNANNTASLDQTVTNNTFNYTSPGSTTASLSFGATGTGIVASLFSTSKAIQVTSVQVFASNATGSVAGVLFDASGTELARSATRALTAADAGTLLTLPLPTPVSVPVGSFYAGANLISGAGLGAQPENPTRSGAFFQIKPTGPEDLSSNNLGRFNLGVVTAPVATAVRNAELTAATTLAPNPARQRFTLSVPAGSLRTASATLVNALGQTVATRQLNLPAAGGSTDFDVSNLAAGVYTLTLKSGDDLVVKRVVVE